MKACVQRVDRHRSTGSKVRNQGQERPGDKDVIDDSHRFVCFISVIQGNVEITFIRCILLIL